MEDKLDDACASQAGNEYEPPEDVPNRITVVEMVYFQSPGENPLGVESRYSRKLTTDEQPCERRLKATENWQELDRGWVDQASLIVISNQETIAGKILEVAYRDAYQDTWLVLPGESMRASPSDASRLIVRSQSGTTRFTANLFPR